MGTYSPYGTVYKAKVVSRLPFLKNVIIESVERKKWHWLLKILTSSIETEILYNIYTENDKYYKEDIITYDATEITKEEADALLEETNAKYGPIMQAAWDYDIPVYGVGASYFDPAVITKALIRISKSTTTNIVTPNIRY